MKTKNKPAPSRRILIILSVYLSVILAALILGVTNQIANWVAQVTIALSLGRLVFLAGWGVARNGKGWRV